LAALGVRTIVSIRDNIAHSWSRIKR